MSTGTGPLRVGVIGAGKISEQYLANMSAFPDVDVRFVADLIPTTAHLQDPWVMGYDLFPMETMAFKQRFIREAIDREYLIVFEHDPLVAAGYIRERDGRRSVEPVL